MTWQPKPEWETAARNERAIGFEGLENELDNLKSVARIAHFIAAHLLEEIAEERALTNEEASMLLDAVRIVEEHAESTHEAWLKHHNEACELERGEQSEAA